MSITDELRKWGYGFCGDTHDVVTAIADRIDAEHEAQLNDAFETRNSDENLESDGWIRLPKDADGEYIHIGERVQLIGNDPSTVSHMSLADDGWRVYVKYDGGIGTRSGEPKRIRHYHAPTVEDVLREMADRIYADEDEPRDRDAIVAEFAKRLTLAEVEDA